MTRGAAWTLAATWGDRVFGILTVSVLARLLTPTDFGLIGMAVAAIAMVDAFTSFGFEWALVRQPNLEPKHLDTAWTLRVGIACGIFIVLMALAGPIAAYFQEPRLKAIVMILAAAKVVNSLENIGMVIFRREFRFEKEFALNMWTRLANILVTIPVAILTRSYWALVVGLVTSRVAGLIITYALHPYRPRFSLAAGRELFNFSFWLQVTSVIQMLKDRSTDFVLGRIVGAHGVAVYLMSHQVADLATSELSAPINRAVYSGYAKLAGDPGQLRNAYLSVASVIWLVALPAVAGLACTAPQVIVLFLGPQWVDAVPVLQLLAIGGLASVMVANTHSVFLTMGKPMLNTILSAVTVAMLLPSVIVFAKMFGVVGAAAAYAATTWITLPIIFWMLHRLIRVDFGQLFRRVWRTSFATAAMVASVLAIRQPPAEGFGRNLVDLILYSAVGAAIYFICLYLTWRMSGRPEGAETHALDIILTPLRQRLTRRRAARDA